MLLLVYVYDWIILSNSKARKYVLIHSLKNGKEKYIFTEEGSIDKLLGISISKRYDNRYELAHLLLMERII